MIQFIQLRFLVMLACFGLSPAVRAVDPPPDGGYPGQNTAEGDNALFSLTTGTDNTAMGFQALFNNTFGSANTASGSLALYSNTTGGLNTATGDSALFFNTTGNNNTATGDFALSLNTTGDNNTATGGGALGSNTTGSNNTATGDLALGFNTTGSGNTASGGAALFFNDTGSNNTATGVGALFGCSGGECGPSRGNNNTATGASALLGNVTGNGNTATGSQALQNTTGSDNIALGTQAGFNLTTGSNNIDIGAFGASGESNTIRIGRQAIQYNTYIQGISGVAVTGSQVVVAPNGKLSVTTSSARFKQDIEPMDKASEAILALKPVTFHYKKEIDPDGIPQFGLVAEQVEKVNPDLVARDGEGKVYTVRYEAVNAMLLNEFLKAHRKIEEQEVTIARQQKQIEALTAGLQKVSAQLEASKPVPQVVNNNQ